MGGISGGGERGSQEKTSSGWQTTNQQNLAQGWGAPTIAQQMPYMQGMQNIAGQGYMTPQTFTPQQMQSWGNTMQAMQGYGDAGPYGQYAQQYMQPILQGGWQQYTDPETQASQREYLMNALPAERQLFSEQAAKQLGPYRSGGEAAAFGSQYGQLLLDQASRQQNLEGQIGQQNVAAKQLYGQQAPGLTQQYASMQDPSSWGKTMLQMGGLPQDYATQQRQTAFNQLMPLSQMMQGYGLAAYQYPAETKSLQEGRSYDIAKNRSFNMSGNMQYSMCWIVDAIFGRHTPIGQELVYMVNKIWPTSAIGKHLYNLYKEYGQEIARYIKRDTEDSKLMKGLLRDFFLNQLPRGVK